MRATNADAFQVAPSLELARASADAVARLHARYWGAAGLAELGLGLATPEDLDAYFSHIEPGLEPMLEELGETLPPARRELLRRIFGEHRRLLQAASATNDASRWCTGDLNPGNLLWPRRGAGPVYLIDRQPFDWSLQRWLCALDLARLIVLPWAPESRREWQVAALRCYHDVLARAGVEMPWQLLFDDYRLAALESVQIAVEWCADAVTRIEKARALGMDARARPRSRRPRLRGAARLKPMFR